LEDVLKNGIRNEAKLIGYNEDPIDVVDLVGLDVENLNILETFGGNSERSSSYVIRRGLPQAPSKTEDRLPQKAIIKAGMWMNSCVFYQEIVNLVQS